MVRTIGSDFATRSAVAEYVPAAASATVVDAVASEGAPEPVTFTLAATPAGKPGRTIAIVPVAVGAQAALSGPASPAGVVGRASAAAAGVDSLLHAAEKGPLSARRETEVKSASREWVTGMNDSTVQLASRTS